jgi:hypothetical protein
MIVGPGWKGETPKGVKAVFQSETEFAYILFRTQLFNPADLDNVKKIQAGYHAQTLSQYLKQPAPPASPAVNLPKPTPEALTSPALFSYLNFMLQFCPTNPLEKDLMDRFAKLTSAPENFRLREALSRIAKGSDRQHRRRRHRYGRSDEAG